MKRARLLGFAAIALAGCRAVLGIQDLSVSADGGGPSADGSPPVDVTIDTATSPQVDSSLDSSVDSSMAASADASKDSAPPPPDGPHDAGPIADAFVCGDSSAMGGCMGCCRQVFASAVTLLEAYSREAGCLCGPSTCLDVDACASSVCATPQTDPPPPECGMCVDMTINGAGCQPARVNCAQDPSCVPYMNCFGMCMP